jgi:hypothetical protein
MAMKARTVALAKNFPVLFIAPLGIVEPVRGIKMGLSTNGGDHTAKQLVLKSVWDIQGCKGIEYFGNSGIPFAKLNAFFNRSANRKYK